MGWQKAYLRRKRARSFWLVILPIASLLVQVGAAGVAIYAERTGMALPYRRVLDDVLWCGATMQVVLIGLGVLVYRRVPSWPRFRLHPTWRQRWRGRLLLLVGGGLLSYPLLLLGTAVYLLIDLFAGLAALVRRLRERRTPGQVNDTTKVTRKTVHAKPVSRDRHASDDWRASSRSSSSRRPG